MTKLFFKFAFVALFSVFGVTVFAVDPQTDAHKFGDWNVVGPMGGDVRSVAIDPKNKDKIFVGTLDGQIYGSLDAGKSWNLVANLNAPQVVIDNLIVDSVDSLKIYASGHIHREPGGFFRSVDGGKTWNKSPEMKNESIHALAQSNADPSVLFAGTVGGMWRSNDSGATWTKVSNEPTNVDSIAVDPRGNGVVYAGTWWRPYKSTDNGLTWKLIKTGMIDDSDVFAVNIDPRDPNHVVASACSGIYESFNGGELWRKFPGIPSSARRTRDILQHPTIAGTVYAATTEGFWMTSDGGKSWSMNSRRDLEINAIAVHPDAPNRVYLATNNYGVLISDDGGKTLSQSNMNFTSRFTYNLTADLSISSRLYAVTRNTATGGGFVFYSNDSGNTWKPASGFDIARVSPFTLHQDPALHSRIYMGAASGVFVSTDRGENWKPVPAAKVPVVKAVPKKGKGVKPAPAPKIFGSIANNVKVLEPTNDGKNGMFAGTDKGLYRTYDISKGWERLNLGVGVADNVFAVHVNPKAPKTIWVGTAVAGVLVSVDGGATFQKMPGVPTGVPISTIASDPSNAANVYVGNIYSIFLTRDSGLNWSRRGGNLPLGNYTSILVNPKNTNEVFASSSLVTDGGVYYSADAGTTWKRLDSKDMHLPSRRAWAMAFDNSNPDRIFIGTHSGGVYRLDRKHIDSAESDPLRPRVIGN